MCSHRSAECTRSLSGRRRLTCGGSSVTSRGLLAAAVLNVRSRDLLVAGEIDRLRCGGEREILLDQLMRAVLSRRLDEQSVIALRHRPSGVVTAVPDHAVFARQAGRARYRRDEIGPALLRREPAAQLADVARAASVRV